MSRWENRKIQKNSKQQVIWYDRYQLSFREWLIYGAAGVGVCGIIAYSFYRSAIVFAVLCPLGAAFPLYYRRVLIDKRKKRLRQEFKEAVIILGASLSAGYSVENGLVNSVKELEMLYGKDSMIVREFAYMVKGIRMNCPVEQVFGEFAARSGLDDIRNFSQIFAIAKRSGGELASIMSKTADAIRDRIQVQEEIETMTAAKRYEQNVMNLIPFGIIAYVDITSPGFFQVLYTTEAGRILMTICLAVYVTAIWISGKILSIEI